MRNKWKVLVMCLVMAAVVLLEPVSYARAEEGTYSEEVPYMNGISVDLIRFDLNPFNYIFAETNKQSHIKRIEFRYGKQSNINYSEYEFVFDFDLKTQLEDGTLVDTEYRYVIDGDSDEGTVSQLDSILIFFDLKDDYFSWSFTYEDLVMKSPFCEVKKDLLQQKSYNTVVSGVDCYIRSKKDLNYGLISRFDFTWYEDFYMQNCSKISYELVNPISDDVLFSDFVEHHKFAASLNSDGNNLYYDISSEINRIIGFTLDIPSLIIELVKGFYKLGSSLPELMKAVFPFIPGFIFDFFGIIVFLSIIVALVFRFMEK